MKVNIKQIHKIMKKKGFWKTLQILYNFGYNSHLHQSYKDYSISLELFFKLLDNYKQFYSVRKELFKYKLIKIYGSPRRITLTKKGREFVLSLEIIQNKFLNREK